MAHASGTVQAHRGNEHNLKFLYHANEIRTRFHPWIRGQDRRPPTGDGEDRLLEQELEYYRKIWWDHVDRLKGRAPLEAGIAGVKKE